MTKYSIKVKELEAEVAKLKSSVQELKVLNEIAVSSGKAASVDDILNLIVQKSVSAVDAEQGSILLITSNKEKPFTTIVKQDDSSSLKHNYHIGTNISGWVLTKKKPLIIENLSEEKRFKSTEEEKRDIKSVLCVPIWQEGTIMGLMTLINKKNKKNFSKDDLTLLSIISVQAGQLIKNLDLQRQSFQKKQEAEKLHELDALKTRFFTDISHEFRTPLTLILGPAKQILEKTTDEKIKQKVGVIYRNANWLNNLANEILELSKIEAGQMSLRTKQQDLLIIIRQIVSSFQSIAKLKNITLESYFEQNEVLAYIDRDKIEKILNNLLSNALKFTNEGGYVKIDSRVFVSEDSENKYGDFVEIKISDSGIGIPKEHLNKVFNRFYRIEDNLNDGYNGTGIGLALTKELVELHKGKISVQSEKGVETIFRVAIPLDKKHFFHNEIIDAIDKGTHPSMTALRNEPTFYGHDNTSNQTVLENKNRPKSSTKNLLTDLPSLLIIEDNKDLRNYIETLLTSEYNLAFANDGEDGLEKAFDIVPDLIVSDIMMPNMDGIELCKNLKADARTSHIPLILLTAKGGVNEKLEGLETGADEYITKPFDASILRARIVNILKQRKRIHDHLQKLGFLVDEGSLTPTDKSFLKQTIRIINEHISDPSFSVEVMADHLAMSRSLLHRKLIGLVGESPSEVIKRVRLNKAAKFIENNTGNISQIAFEVGFNNPSYFAKCFQKQFGINPSQYHQKIIKS